MAAMTLHDISLIGWVHAVACIVAMIAGTAQLFRAKGTATHSLRGSLYFWSMIVLNVTALFIFRMDVAFRGKGAEFGPVFGVFHWLAVVTLVILILARIAASRQQRAFFAYSHPICMIVTYWFLMGGAINQAFERVDWVREAALAVSPNARHVGEFKLLLFSQLGLDLIILVAIVLAVIRVRRFRRQSRASSVEGAQMSAALTRQE